jgi:hypothetical protein
VQALGVVGERAVAPLGGGGAGRATVAAAICDALLPLTMADAEPCGELPAGSLGGDESWVREGAAVGLLRLCSGGSAPGIAQVIEPTTPAYHSDARFVTALCDAALRRARVRIICLSILLCLELDCETPIFCGRREVRETPNAL